MPFKKGQSGNPKGRPKKGDSFNDYLEKAIKKLKSVQKDKTSGTVIARSKGKAVLASALTDLATNQNYPPQIRLQAIKEIFDRIDGKPRQSIEMAADIESVVNNRAVAVKARLDALSPEERDAYFRLCEKVDASSSK